MVSIFDYLFENSVFVSNTITPSRDFKGGKRVNEASSESSKTTVSKSSIALLLVKFLKVISHIHKSVPEIAFKVRVNEGVLECSSHQKFERKVVHPLAVVVVVVLLGVVPRLDESISDGVSSSLISTEVVKVESGSSQGVLNMVDDLSLDGLFVVSKVRLHELPHLLSSLLGVVVLEFRLKKHNIMRYLIAKLLTL